MSLVSRNAYQGIGVRYIQDLPQGLEVVIVIAANNSQIWIGYKPVEYGVQASIISSAGRAHKSKVSPMRWSVHSGLRANCRKSTSAPS